MGEDVTDKIAVLQEALRAEKAAKLAAANERWRISQEPRWERERAEKEAARAARIAAWRAERQTSCQTKRAQSR